MINNYNILVTNDDGIESPGLKAAVQAVMPLGTVTVTAPRYQQTGAGRGLTGEKEATLQPVDYTVDGVQVEAYHCKCSPALVVRHALRTLFLEKKPDLLVSGINYGENLGVNITCSGTVGAALEASSHGIPGIAISKQTEVESHHAYNSQNWSASQHFLTLFSQLFALKHPLPDVDVLKIEIPADATPETRWKITTLARTAYYYRELEAPGAHSRIGDGRTIVKVDTDLLDRDSDIYALAVEKIVSVTPLSLDLTSRIVLADLQIHLQE